MNHKKMTADDAIPEAVTYDQSPDIPIVLNDTVRWITGLTSRTTCDDVIYALLYNDGNHGGETTEDYAIYEIWRDVEKPLQARTKILKVWRAWGVEQSDVLLRIKLLKENQHNHQRKHRRSSKSRTRHHNGCGCRPGAHKNCYTSGRVRSLESLVKLVIVQERKLRELGERITRTDMKIESLETRRHFNRMKDNGDNYVQSVYLDSLSEDSMDEIFGSVKADDIDEYLSYCQRIIKMEDTIDTEKCRVSEFSKLVEETLLQNGLPNDLDPNASMDELIEHARVAITRLVAAGVMERYNEEAVKQEITLCDGKIDGKRNMILSLKEELDFMEEAGQEQIINSVLGNKRQNEEHGLHFDYASTIANTDIVLSNKTELKASRYDDNATKSKVSSGQFAMSSNYVNVRQGQTYTKSNYKYGNQSDLNERVNTPLPSLDSTNDDDDDDDRVSVIQILDAPPSGRSKSVTFNDRLNHMHVIGTSRESLTVLTNRKHSNIDSEITCYQPHPVSILKHNSRPNEPILGESIIYGDADMPSYGRYHLPSGMYTFAKDGHYSLLDSYKHPYKEEDSNSDTGLSSMHSDESTGLETLV